MFHKVSRVIRCAVYAAVAATAFTATVAAAQTAAVDDLGKAWPGTQDQSASPNWHAYVFERDGVRYVQINDRNGTMHAAIGMVGSTAFALPMGLDASNVEMTSLSDNVGTSSDVIYQDDSIRVALVPQTDSATRIQVMAMCPPDQCTQNGSH
jgi:hypothetical protein